MSAEYHIVDCHEVDCPLCPAAFRGADESDAISTAKSHGEDGSVEVVDVGVSEA